MTTQAHPNVVGTPGQGRRVAVGAGAALLAIAAALSLGVWLNRSPTETRATREQSPPVSGGQMAATPVTVAAAETLTVYLVGSDAEGVTLLRAIKQAVTRYEGGDMPTNEMVLVAGTAEERTHTHAALKDLRLQLDDGALRVIDLRGA